MKCVKIIEDKKALEVAVLDVKGLSHITSYFVICTCTSNTHVRTVADELHRKMKESGIRGYHTDGLPDCRWVVVDYIDVIVHIFLKETRDYYQLETLWKDAKRIIPDTKIKSKKVSSK